MDATLLPTPARPATTHGIHMLLAEQDADTAADLAARARAEVDGLTVLLARDAADAIQLGLNRSPALAVIDLGLPMGGFGAAVTLRELRPRIQLAVHGADLPRYRGRAQKLHAPFFSRGEWQLLIDWVRQTCSSERGPRDHVPALPRHGFICAACGYGITRAVPPDRCPMCGEEASWTPEPWRPFSRSRALPG